MNLISLIARQPKTVDSLEDMIEAIKVLCNDIGGSDEKDKLKIPVDVLKTTLTSLGEKMDDHEIQEILDDCIELQHDESILIDDLANYLMSR